MGAADHAIGRLDALSSKPFLITASLNYPHDPNVVPSPYYEMFHPADIKLPGNFLNCAPRFEGDWSREMVVAIGEIGLRELLRIYYASVHLIDAQVGRILGALDRTGRAEGTIVVFTTDHGDMAGGHGMFWKSTEAFYDEIVRVPLILSYPGRIKPGTNSMAVSSADLMPTLLELTGERPPKAAEGHSLAPNLLGLAPRIAPRRYSFCERVSANPAHTRQLLPGVRGSFMIRGEGWKFIRYADGEEFLYHLTDDPGEIRDLSAEPTYRDRKADLSGEIDGWLHETHYPKFA